MSSTQFETAQQEKERLAKVDRHLIPLLLIVCGLFAMVVGTAIYKIF